MSSFEEKQRKAALGLELLAKKKALKGEKMSDSQQAMLEGLKAKGVDPTKSEKWEKAQRGMEILEDKKKGMEILKAKEGEGEQTIVCPSCNKEVPMGNFCGNCGGKLEKIEEAEKTKICPNCNKEVPMGKFCSSCGNKLEASQEDPAVEENEQIDEIRDRINKM